MSASRDPDYDWGRCVNTADPRNTVARARIAGVAGEWIEVRFRGAADIRAASQDRRLRAHVGHWFANALIPKAVESIPVLVTEVRGERSFVEQGSAKHRRVAMEAFWAGGPGGSHDRHARRRLKLGVLVSLTDIAVQPEWWARSLRLGAA